MVINMAVLEDEQVYIDKYKHFLKEWHMPELKCKCDTFTEGKSLLAHVQKDADYHIIFLDIKLPNDDGMEIAVKLRKLGYKNLIVFVTSYSDYLQEGYEVGAYRYLLKPLRIDKFQKCLEAAVQIVLGGYLKISENGALHQIPYNQISHISNLGHHVTIHSQQREYKIIIALRTIVQNLPVCFVQCHRSFIVNLNYISSIEGKSIFLLSGEEIPISKKHLQSIRNAFVTHYR